MRLLLSFLFSLHALILFAQKEVFYAKPVAQMMDSNTSELAYGQKNEYCPERVVESGDENALSSSNQWKS